MSISNLSDSIYDVNIPEVTNFNCKFIYNFYTRDERNNKRQVVVDNFEQVPRYVRLSWTLESKTSFIGTNPGNLIQSNVSNILYEDRSFYSTGFASHTFSNVSFIERGSSDLEIAARSTLLSETSVSNMAKQEIDKIRSGAPASLTDSQQHQLQRITDAYDRLVALPSTNLGLQFLNKEGDVLSSGQDFDILRDVKTNLSLSTKVNLKVAQDTFRATVLDDVTTRGLNHPAPKLPRVEVSPIETNSDIGDIIGFLIKRYVVTPAGYKEDDVYYVEDPQTTTFIDTAVAYGESYIYSIRVVSCVEAVVLEGDSPVAKKSLVASRTTNTAVKCFEYKPPPPPSALRFQFDYVNNKLIVSWQLPVNTQGDIKQFQVLRRASIRHPFELIAQYGFDDSEIKTGQNRYTTGEKIDANNIENTRAAGYAELVISSTGPVTRHIDEDFVIDTEFFVNEPKFIYAVCSVDAHGMISNYSKQYEVTFDPYKNKLVVNVVCEEGSPRQYPNLTIRADAFKDTIKASGDECRKLSVHFNPEVLKVSSPVTNKTFDLVATATPDSPSYYLLQMINTDNQKLQQVQIFVKDS